jgi:hypothetical protein
MARLKAMAQAADRLAARRILAETQGIHAAIAGCIGKDGAQHFKKTMATFQKEASNYG